MQKINSIKHEEKQEHWENFCDEESDKQIN
jgi:hypothetical protein